MTLSGRLGRLGAVIGLAVVLGAAPVTAQEEVQDLPVFGSFSPDEVGFIISGIHARKIFDSMTTPHTTDPCTGGWSKTDASGFNCLVHPDGETQCSFGYNYRSQRLTAGPLTC